MPHGSEGKDELPWRHDRRGFVRYVLSFGAALLAGQTACRPGLWSASNLGSSSERAPDREAAHAPTQGAGPPVVAVVRGQSAAEMVRQAVALAGGLEQVVRPGATVLIKPNLTIPSASGLGNVTDSRVLQATIELCQRAGAARVLVGDGSGGGDSKAIMQQAGYEPVLRATGATFVDLNEDEVVTRRLADPSGLTEYSLARTAVEAPALLSLAVLKVHNTAMVSLSCKNLMGIAARSVYGRPRQQLHATGVQRVIADLVRLRTPDFAIIDGTIGLEGDSSMHGTPVPMNLVIAGRNPVSVDAVGSTVMGLDPRQVEHLTRLTEKGLGEIDPAKITVRGVAIADVQRRFQRV